MIRFLQQRGRVQRVMLVGFLSLICLAMVTYLIPGMSDLFSNKMTGDTVARIGDKTITTAELNAQVSLAMQQNRVPEEYRPRMIAKVAQEMVLSEALNYEASRLGLSTSNEELREVLRRRPDLYNDGKPLTQEQYAAYLDSRWHLPVATFEKLMRAQLTQDKLRLAVTGGITVGEQELHQAYFDGNAKVKFDYAVLSLEDVKKSIQPSDAELKAYYEKHAKDLAARQPDQRKVAYAVITPDKLPGGAQPSDAEMQSFFNQNRDKLRKPETATASHILILSKSDDPADKQKAAEAKAAAIAKQAKSGADFAKLANANTEDPSGKGTGGALPAFTREQMVPEFSQAVFGGQEGQVVGPVRTRFGYHIIKIGKKSPAMTPNFDQLRKDPQFMSIVAADKLSKQYDDMAKKLAADARSKGMQNAVASYGAKVTFADNINYANYATQLPGLAVTQPLGEYLFVTKSASAAQAFRTPSGLVVAQLLEVKAAQPPAFETVKAQLVDQFRAESANDVLTKKMQQLSAKAKQTHDIRAAAKEVGATVKSSDQVSISSQLPDLGQISQIPNVNKMKVGDVSDAVNTGSNGVVAVLTARQDPSAAEYAAGKAQLHDQLLDQKRNVAFSIYSSTLIDRLKKEGKLKINEAVINQLAKATTEE